MSADGGVVVMDNGQLICRTAHWGSKGGIQINNLILRVRISYRTTFLWLSCLNLSICAKKLHYLRSFTFLWYEKLYDKLIKYVTAFLIFSVKLRGVISSYLMVIKAKLLFSRLCSRNGPRERETKCMEHKKTKMQLVLQDRKYCHS